LTEFFFLLYAFFVEKLPYITIAVFFTGIVIRLNRWLSAPPSPEKTKLNLASALRYILLDGVLFGKTYRDDKPTWLVLFLFHIGVGGILFGHLRSFKWWSIQWFEPLGNWVTEFLVETLPFYVGWMFITTQVILLVRRRSLKGKQLVAHSNGYIVLVLLLITSILGQGMRIFPPEVILTEAYSIVFIPGFIVFHLDKVPSQHWFFWHIFFTQLLVMYLPFSKLIHVHSDVITSALYDSRRKEYGI
jgi:nitrate reductase gamma subunit